MNRTVAAIGIVIIANSCIWGCAMIMASRALAGTGAYEQIQHILGGSAAMSLLVVGGGLGGLVGLEAGNMKRRRQENDPS
jgi:hypothetical protein